MDGATAPKPRVSAQMQVMAKSPARSQLGAVELVRPPDLDRPLPPLKGFNNKIGAMQRQAYGYRNYEHLKERLLTLHHTKYTLQV